MADFKSQETPAGSQRSGATEHSKIVRTLRTFVCAGQASGSRLVLDTVPDGARAIGHEITVSATLATSTLAIGNAGTPAKYAAAATYTAADTPVRKKKAALQDDVLAADEPQFATVGVAALPNDGTIIAIETTYTIE